MEITKASAEGAVAKILETGSTRIPSAYYLWTGLGLLGASFLFKALKKKNAGAYIGELAKPLLVMGVYNKVMSYASNNVNGGSMKSSKKKKKNHGF
jgi:hypothetical protein